MRRAIWSADWNLAHDISKLDWLFQPTFVHSVQAVADWDDNTISVRVNLCVTVLSGHWLIP